MTADFTYFSTTRPDSLANALDNVQTQVVLSDGTSFPDPAQYDNSPYTVIVGYGTDREEVCTVTAKPTTTTLTVIRGQDGTPATAKNAGDTVVHGVSAREFNSMQNRVDRLGDSMSGPLVLYGNAAQALEAVPLQQVQSLNTDQDIATQTALAGKASTNSPIFTGSPQAPTPAAGANDNRIATTAFVQTAAAARAPLASPVFTGNPTAPTPPSTDNDTSLATTAFVQTVADREAGERVVNSLSGSSTTTAPSVAAVNAALVERPMMATGLVTLTGNGTDSRSETVSFGVTFDSPPVVLVQELTGMSASGTTQTTWPSSITTTGCNIQAVRSNSTALTVRWVALGTF